VNSLEPVILQDNPAVSALGPLGIVIVRSVVWPVCEVVSIAEALDIVVGMDLHPDYGLEERLSDEGWYSLNGAVSVFDIQVDAEWAMPYTISLTLESLVGGGSWWEEKAYCTLGKLELMSCLIFLLIMLSGD